MRSDATNVLAIDGHDFCEWCDFEGEVNVIYDYDTNATYWECPNEHPHTGVIW
jgi:hypothetical protein